MTDLMTLDPLLIWIAVACVATLFAHAAIGKLGDRALFEQHLAAYGVPMAFSGVLAWLLPIIEVMVALLLLTPWRTLGAVGAALLLLVYAAAMAWHRAQDHALDCGCGGDPLPLSWALVIRNTLLAMLAMAAAAPMATRSLAIGDFFVIAAALVLGTLLHAALHQMLRHRARLSPRS